MFKLMLNLHKPNNYAFFCPVSKVHLTVSNPVGFANEVTPAILKAIKADTVTDVDGVIDLGTGKVAGRKAPVKTENPTQKEVSTVSQTESTDSKEQEVPVNEPVDVAEDTMTEEPKTSKKGKKANK